MNPFSSNIKTAERPSKTSYSSEWVLVGQAYSLPLRGLLVASLAVLAGLTTSSFLAWFPPIMFGVAFLIALSSTVVLFLCAKGAVKVNLGTSQFKVGHDVVSLNKTSAMVYYHGILKIIVKNGEKSGSSKNSYEIKIPVRSLSKEKLAIVKRVVFYLDPTGSGFPASKRVLQDINAAFPEKDFEEAKI